MGPVSLPVPHSMSTPSPYFRQYEHRRPPPRPPLSRRRAACWHALAGATVAFSAFYLHWRWTASLNPDALLFSALVAGAETLFFLGTMLFFFDIWDEGDTPWKPAAALCRGAMPMPESAPEDPPESPPETVPESPPVTVDVFITTYDEDTATVAPSIAAARAMRVPAGVRVSIHLLDDGARPAMSLLARQQGIGYLTRGDNTGFKAGNLRNAILQTSGDFILICDADTRVFDTFLENTLGYFCDPKVAWVQTPHWFYDIPGGTPWDAWVARRLGRGPDHPLCRMAAACLSTLSGRTGTGQDPFLSDPAFFFDVIQRRRNRNGASFCCGAGSIHRRSAILDNALRQLARDQARAARRVAAAPLAGQQLQPYRFHVSEDIYTSLQLHSDPARNWSSVYHPRIESRMLSPWSVRAWATQRLKYAGGTFDILWRDSHLLSRGLGWRRKLHYAATYWSYLSVLWTPVMLLAPVVSMLSGVAPVTAYSLEFFCLFLPPVLCAELAMLATGKRHDIQAGRIMAIGGIEVQARALWQVLAGRRPAFPPTPKTPAFSAHWLSGLPYLQATAGLLLIQGLALVYGCAAYLSGAQGYGLPFLVVNVFWIGWNSLGLLRVCATLFWRPDAAAPHKGTAHGTG